jgi:hypothetical protein
MIEFAVGDSPMCAAHSGMTTCLVCRMADSRSTPAPRVTKVRQYRFRRLPVVTCAAAARRSSLASRSGTR